MTTSNKAVYTGVIGRAEIFNTGNIPADIFGGNLDDYIFANAQHEYIEGGTDKDHIRALGGDDTIYGDNRTDGTEGSAVGSLTIEADVILGGTGNDTVYGQSGFDYVNGEDGNDLLSGGLGDDFLQGGDGIDIIFGGAGDDEIWGGGSTNVPASYAKTISYTHDGITDQPLAGTVDSSFGVIGAADTSTDIVDGGEGNDRIYTQAGNDTIQGGNGDDNIVGGEGADQIDGGFGFDYARYEASTAGVTVRLDGSTGVGGEAAGDTFANIEGLVGSNLGDTLVGSAAANILFGLVGDDALFGDAGNDVLAGGDGFDQLNGGAGADLLDGGADFDFARYDFATSGVTARLDGGAGAGEGAGDTFVSIEGLVGSESNDTLVGNGEANTIFGQSGADDIYGGASSDNLDGGSGNDSLTGGTGSDVLNGNVGNDQFRFALSDLTVGDHDIIKDFGESGINFDALLLPSGVGISSADTAGGALITFQLAGGTADVLLQGFTVAQLADQYFFV